MTESCLIHRRYSSPEMRKMFLQGLKPWENTPFVYSRDRRRMESLSIQWRASLEQRPTQAKQFYGVLAVATLIGRGLNFLGINPIRAHFGRCFGPW
jgi:hypothetical protein